MRSASLLALDEAESVGEMSGESSHCRRLIRVCPSGMSKLSFSTAASPWGSDGLHETQTQRTKLHLFDNLTGVLNTVKIPLKGQQDKFNLYSKKSMICNSEAFSVSLLSWTLTYSLTCLHNIAVGYIHCCVWSTVNHWLYCCFQTQWEHLCV